jgi:hypothetical protein
MEGTAMISNRFVSTESEGSEAPKALVASVTAHGAAHGGDSGGVEPLYFPLSRLFSLAEDGGFEPPRALTQHAFQACAIGH